MTVFPSNLSRSRLRTILIDRNSIPYICAVCQVSEWQGQKLSLHLDHINGKNRDNHIENLRFLCPNCHSLTDTYCGKNKQKYSIKNKKVSDEDMLSKMKSLTNPIEVFQSFGLAGAGNYQRLYQLAEKNDIHHMKKGNTIRRSPYKEKLSKSCVVCGMHYFTFRANQKFCSLDCSNTSKQTYDISTAELYQIWLSNNKNFRQTSLFVGMSDNAIRKRFRKIGLVDRGVIETPSKD